MPRHFGADRRYRQEVRPARSTSWSPATPTAPMSARSTGGSSPQATNTARSSPRSISSSIPSRATSSAPRPTTASFASATLAKDAEQTALIEVLRQARRADRQPPGGLGDGNAVARAQQCRRKPARRHHRRRATRRDQRRGERRRGDRLHQSRRRARRHHAQGGRRGDLWRPVRQPAVPQSTGDDHADRKADQGHAGAAMARSEAAKDPAGVEGFWLCVGRIEGRRRTRASPSGCR